MIDTGRRVTYGRKRKERDAHQSAPRRDQLSLPRLGHGVTVADGAKCDLHHPDESRGSVDDDDDCGGGGGSGSAGSDGSGTVIGCIGAESNTDSN